MIAGTRCQAHSLKHSLERYNGQQGVMQWIVPETGRYSILFDKSQEELLKLENVMALEHEEAVDECSYAGFSELTVNGLCYCAEHRREVCGICNVDHRITNRLKELDPSIPPEEAMGIACQMQEDEQKQNTLARLAPVAGSGKDQANLKFDKKQLPEKGLNPSKLSIWNISSGKSVKKCFERFFSLREMINSNIGVFAAKDDHMGQMRETLLIIAASCDEHKRTPRFVIQDEAQTAAIMIDVLEIRDKESKESKKSKESKESESKPMSAAEGPDLLLVVRYFYCTAAAMSGEKAQSIEASLSEGMTFNQISDELPAIELMHNLLKKGNKRLDSSYLDHAKKDLFPDWEMSVLQPILPAAPEIAKVIETCATCGKDNPAKTCARCKVRKYCSKECQKRNWKIHKETCRSPENDPGAKVATVALGTLASEGCAFAAVLNHDRRDRNFGGLVDFKKEHSMKKDKQFIVKVQVDMTADFKSIPMFCYDMERKMQCYISPENCPGAADLAVTIRSKGIVPPGYDFGAKGYFNAYATGANELKILFHEVLPLQPW